ncbi:unnamed protein product, partial [Rotaria sp. Silwood2]
SFYQNEDEILLLPGREFEVVSSMDMGHQLTMIQLKEVAPRFPNIASVTSSEPSTITTTGTAATTAKPVAAAAAVVPKPAPKPKPPVQQVEVSYRQKNITDADIPRVIKEAIVQQQCTKLDLFGNKITHEGAALLAKALRNNTNGIMNSLNPVVKRSKQLMLYLFIDKHELSYFIALAYSFYHHKQHTM